MSEERNIKQLLQEGIEAAREGDKATARARFEEVVELDENNERGWFWLASVVDSDEEKRICLGNVLHINPNNERAKQMMDKLEAKARQRADETEVIPGITRRQLILIGGGGAIVLVVLIAIVLVVVVSNNSRRNAEAALGTRVAQEATDVINQANTRAVEATQTQIAAVGTPTFTPFAPLFTLPPTFTPTPSDTPEAGAVVLPPPPPEVTGNIVGWSGRDTLQNNYLPPVVFALNGQQYSVERPGSPINDELVQDVVIHPSGSRVAYTIYQPSTFDFSIEMVNLNGTQPLRLADLFRLYNIDQAHMPSYAPDGTHLAFVATSVERQVEQLYLLDLNVALESGSAIRPITNDNAVYAYPAISPDGTTVAVVRDDVNSANPGADVVIVDIASGQLRPVTTSLGAFVESVPRWSPDGTQIVYAVAPATDAENRDIFISQANGAGTPLPIARDPADDVNPVFSPDGRYIAFSSNRSGEYEIYIYDQVTTSLWQLTDTETDEDYPGGWW